MYTLQGKTRPTHHTLSTLGPHMALNHTYLTWSTYNTISRVTNRFGRIPLLLRKKGTRHNSQHTDRPIHGSVPSFSHKPTNEAVSLSQASVKDKLLGLLDPYHQHAIGTFKTCSRGPTYRSLTNTGRGYNLGGTSFPHTTPWPSQPAVSTFHLRAPPGF
jgi:hypothetical protein